MARKPTAKKPVGFSIYPDEATVREIDRLATENNNKRAPMSVLLIRKGIEVMKKVGSK